MDSVVQRTTGEANRAQVREVVLRRDLEVKAAYISALRERLTMLEAAVERIEPLRRAAEERAATLEREVLRLRELEANSWRSATTPRYWIADQANLYLKRWTGLHGVLRFLAVRLISSVRVDH